MASINPQVLSNAVGLTGPGASAQQSTDPLTAMMNQLAAQQAQYTQAQIASNNAGLQAGYATNIADLVNQQQQGISGEQAALANLLPQIGNIQSQNALANAQAQQNAVFSGAKDQNTLAARGLGTSGIALGQLARDQGALGQTLATQNLTATGQEDALSRQITALQQQTAANTANAQAQINAYQKAAGQTGLVGPTAGGAA